MADPTKCTVTEAAELLAREGGVSIMPAMLEADVKAGAPLNQDGTVNVIVYTSWLLKQGD